MIKNICFIGGGLEGGGMERTLTTMANYFARIGYQVSVINLFRTKQFFELESNIEVIWPKADRNRYNRLVYALITIPFLRRAIKRLNPQVLLSYGEWFNPFVILSTRFIGIPIYVFDLMGPAIKLDILVETSRKIFYRFANGIIVQTNSASRIITEKTGAKNIAIIPNAVNNIDAKSSVKKNQIVTLGRLSHEKGHKILIRAFSMISKKDWTLHIIGDGPERQKLESEAALLGIAEKTKFYGHLKDFSQILVESEIFVLPSFYEGFPNALIEAMSVPLACISSDCIAGPSDIIEDGVNGLLVETGNVDALANALNRLIENRDLRRMLASKAYKVRETLALDKIARNYVDFIIQ